MRIHVQGLPFNQDFATQFQVPVAAISSELTQNDSEATIHFVEPIDCKATLRKMAGDEVLLKLIANTNIQPLCDRCAEPYLLPVSLDICLLCKPLTRDSQAEEEEDEGLVFFTKQEIFLDQIVREQILLNLPIKFVCRPDCKGLCPGCGENLNLEKSEHFCLRPPMSEYKTKVL